MAVVAELEEARLQCAAVIGLDFKGTDRIYKETFAGYGLDLEALSPEEAAQHIHDSAIRVHLISAALITGRTSRRSCGSGLGNP